MFSKITVAQLSGILKTITFLPIILYEIVFGSWLLL